MEGLASRVTSSHILAAPQNLAVSTHYAVSSHSAHCAPQQLQDKLPPTYEEAQMAAQNAELQQIGNLENDKLTIYRHPMFPLLAMLFEKCEQATQTSDCPTSQSFDNDIKDYILQHHREGKPFYSEDPDLDGLMIKAIQVLRIHLLELEKVNELCKDFCQRYIACLKGKMQSENLLRSPMSAYNSPAMSIMSPSLSPLASLQQQPQQQQQQQATQPPQQVQQAQQVYIPQQLAYYTQTMTPCTVAMPTPTASTVIGNQEQQQQPQQQPQVVAAVTYAPQNITQVTQQGQQIVVTQVPQVSQVVPQQQMVAPTSLAFPNQPNMTTLSLASTPSTPTTTSTPIQVGSPAEIIVPSTVPLPALDSPTDGTDNKKKSAKRGILPKQATNIMKTWLFQHLVHPYPTEDEKRAIAAQTNLTILQVNNWFINARRRILQPMLDASNPEGPKAKKSKVQSRPAQRFWPESLVPSQYNAVPIAPAPATSQTTVTGGVPIAMPAGIAMPGGAVHVQPGVTMQAVAVPSGSLQNVVGLPAGVSVPSGVSVPAGMIPTTINMPHNVHPGSIVVVTLPPNANAVPVSSEMEGNMSISTAMTTAPTSSQEEAVPTNNLSPMLAGVRQDSPAALQNSPLPTMAQNGGDSRLVGSPSHIPTSHVDSLAVEGLSMDATTVGSGLHVN